MAAKPIVVHIQGETSKLKKALGEAERGVKGFAKNVGALGIKAGAAFGAAATAGIVAGVGLLASGLGEGSFQLKKIGLKFQLKQQMEHKLRVNWQLKAQLTLSPR